MGVKGRELRGVLVTRGGKGGVRARSQQIGTLRAAAGRTQRLYTALMSLKSAPCCVDVSALSPRCRLLNAAAHEAGGIRSLRIAMLGSVRPLRERLCRRHTRTGLGRKARKQVAQSPCRLLQFGLGHFAGDIILLEARVEHLIDADAKTERRVGTSLSFLGS